MSCRSARSSRRDRPGLGQAVPGHHNPGTADEAHFDFFSKTDNEVSVALLKEFGQYPHGQVFIQPLGNQRPLWNEASYLPFVLDQLRWEYQLPDEQSFLTWLQTHVAMYDPHDTRGATTFFFTCNCVYGG